MRGYYPGEREYRQRPRSRVRPRVPGALGRDLRLPKPRRPRRPPAAAPAWGTDGGASAVGADVRAGEVAGRRVDWAVGILVGVVLGIGVIVAFLAFGSEGTIDAPSIHGVEKQAPRARPLEPVKE